MTLRRRVKELSWAALRQHTQGFYLSTTCRSMIGTAYALCARSYKVGAMPVARGISNAPLHLALLVGNVKNTTWSVIGYLLLNQAVSRSARTRITGPAHRQLAQRAVSRRRAAASEVRV